MDLKNDSIKDEILSITKNASNIKAPTLVADINDFGLDRNRTREFTHEQFSEILKDITRKIQKIDMTNLSEYHNLMHYLEVLHRTRKIAKQVYGDNLYEDTSQILEFSALTHDYNWSTNATLDKQSKFSIEELSAIDVDNLAKEVGFSIHERVRIYGLVISTSFGNDNIIATNLSEQILVLADSGGFEKPDLEWLGDCTSILKEMEYKKRPKDLKAWLDFTMKFLNKAEMRIFEGADDYWMDKLNEKKKLINYLMNDPKQGIYLDYISKNIEPLLGN